MKKTICILKGDGIGPEVIKQALKVMEAVNAYYGHQFKLTYGDIGAVSIDLHGVPLTDDTLTLCKEADAVLMGAIGHPKYDHDPTLKVRPEQGLLRLRKELQLFSNIRPVRSYELLKDSSPLKNEVAKDSDMVIYRELVGGLYFGEKHTSEDGTEASETCRYTEYEISRVAYEAFKTAAHRRKKVTLVDKANVMETSRLWRKVVADIATDFPEVELDYLFVDNAAMQLMLNPRQFDVILTENLFGDILSDLGSVITGSLGMLPSASIGEETAVFEPVHGSFPSAVGKDLANPMATILSLAMMYDYLGLIDEGICIRGAVDWAMHNGFVTEDLNALESCATSKVGEMIALYIENGSKLDFKQENISAAPNFF